MKLRLLPILLLSLATAHADTFGSGGNEFDIDFATIGNAGNANAYYYLPNDSAGESRVFRGGRWVDASGTLASSGRNNDSPSGELNSVGFRVAAVPEPSGVLLTTIGMLSLVLRRKRG